MPKIHQLAFVVQHPFRVAEHQVQFMFLYVLYLVPIVTKSLEQVENVDVAQQK